MGKARADLDQDFLRQGIGVLTQMLIEAEREERIGAARYQRTPKRTTYGNGSRDRMWDTRVGEVSLRIPKLRHAFFLRSLFGPRRRSDRALLAVAQSACVQGVTTRKVDDLLQSLGLAGIEKGLLGVAVAHGAGRADDSWPRWPAAPS